MLAKPFKCDAARRLTALLMLSSILTACSGLGRIDPMGLGRRVQVQPLAAAQECHASGAHAELHWLADAGALNSYESERHFRFRTAGPLPPGPYAVIDLGVRDRPGYGLAVSRRARISGDTLVLNATFFVPPDSDAAVAANGDDYSPCVLLGLPAGSYRVIELRDPLDTLRARGDVIPRSEKGK